jgi:FtsZ-binding cell division protein ZapB
MSSSQMMLFEAARAENCAGCLIAADIIDQVKLSSLDCLVDNIKGLQFEAAELNQKNSDLSTRFQELKVKVYELNSDVFELKDEVKKLKDENLQLVAGNLH